MIFLILELFSLGLEAVQLLFEGLDCLDELWKGLGVFARGRFQGRFGGGFERLELLLELGCFLV